MSVAVIHVRTEEPVMMAKTATLARVLMVSVELIVKVQKNI